LLISITSAGQITPAGKPPYFVVIDRALRDEGTSYHYAKPSEYSEAEPQLVAVAAQAVRAKGVNVITGSSWTTDAPFRETEEAIAAARSKDILAVEMEAAALYAFARASNTKVLCLAHVTNTMAIGEQDFEKGEADGTVEARFLSHNLCPLLDQNGHSKAEIGLSGGASPLAWQQSPVYPNCPC